jgi:mRNA-degrading endonuclease RelE of RelBE toxin-antitoxin system
MYNLTFRESFFKSLKSVKDKRILGDISRKIEQLKYRAPLGKKLIGNPFWSIRVERYRIIYAINGQDIEIIVLLQRKFDYRELDEKFG